MARFVVALVALVATALHTHATTIFDAPSITVMQIRAASVGKWKSVDPSERQHVVDLNLRVERVLRGSLHPGATLKIAAEQREPVGRTFAVAGPWSGKALQPGLRYLVFARSPSETLRVTDIGEVEGVELALAFEDHKWPLSDLERRAGAKRHLLGQLFAEYLSTKLPVAVSQDARQWNSILSFIEAPGLTTVFRDQAAVAAMDAVLMVSPSPDAIVERTVVMAFRLLSLPDESAFHNRLVTTYLPNLLGQEGSERKRTANDIFAAYPGERERADQALREMPPSQACALLKGWIAK